MGIVTAARDTDSVFYNGRVLTLRHGRQRAEAIAVEQGRITVVGENVCVKRIAPRAADKYDLKGRTVVPGFIDCHTHFIAMGVDFGNVDLSGARTLKEALALMRIAARKAPTGEWVIGANWKESSWPECRFITKRDLDDCCPENPAVAHRICGHLSSANTAALSELGLTPSSPGAESDGSGALTGILKEDAVQVVRSATAPDRPRKTKGLLLACKKAQSLGVTSVHDNGGQGDFGLYVDSMRKGELGVRVWFNTPASNTESLRKLSISTGLGSDWLKLGGVKVFCDGALGARTAALSKPYSDDPGNKGMLVYEPDHLRSIISEANDAGMQLAVHAIGDIGIETAISAIAAALKNSPRIDPRHRIEHLELPTPGNLRRMRQLGIIASMQPNFVGEWGGTGGMYYERLGKDRASRCNPFREVVDAGVRMVFGSDCMPFSPIYGISSAVNAVHTPQRLTVNDALAAYTREAAHASFEESLKGTISAGKLADFVVLSADPFDEPAKLSSISVEKTVLGGRVLYDRAQPRKPRSSR